MSDARISGKVIDALGHAQSFYRSAYVLFAAQLEKWCGVGGLAEYLRLGVVGGEPAGARARAAQAGPLRAGPDRPTRVGTSDRIGRPGSDRTAPAGSPERVYRTAQRCNRRPSSRRPPTSWTGSPPASWTLPAPDPGSSRAGPAEHSVAPMTKGRHDTWRSTDGHTASREMSPVGSGRFRVGIHGSVGDERGEEGRHARAVHDGGDGGEPNGEEDGAGCEQRRHGDGLRGVASTLLFDSSDECGILGSEVAFDLVDLTIEVFGVHRSPPAAA